MCLFLGETRRLGRRRKIVHIGAAVCRKIEFTSHRSCLVGIKQRKAIQCRKISTEFSFNFLSSIAGNWHARVLCGKYEQLSVLFCSKSNRKNESFPLSNELWEDGKPRIFHSAEAKKVWKTGKRKFHNFTESAPHTDANEIYQAPQQTVERLNSYVAFIAWSC